MFHHTNAFMKKIIILSLISFVSIAQNTLLKGKVLDAETQQPLPFVNVFVANTTKGTFSDTTGVFTFSNLPIGAYTFVASMVGYSSQSIKVVFTEENRNQEITFTLRNEARSLEEVAIKTKRDKTWENNLKQFRRVFLGHRDNTKLCKIKDEYLIDFFEADGKLLARSNNPLQIENRALGYNITFILKKFESSKTDFLIAGDAFFEELQPIDALEKEIWRKNRLEAYRGSLNHFLQSLARNTTTEDGFVIYAYKRGSDKNITNSFTHNIDLANLLEKVSPQSVLKIEGQAYKLDLSRKLEVHYLPKDDDAKVYIDIQHEVSQIESKNSSATFNTTGTFQDPYSVFAHGAFNHYRVSEMLPLDFQPNIKDLLVNQIATTNTSNYFTNLQERVVLHTNKSNYRLGETLWYKTYQVYTSPVYRDAVSRIVYIDLISPDQEIVESQMLKTQNGVAWGQFTLNDTLPTGNYFLRTYTRWMQNYDDSTQTVLEIPILDKTKSLESPIPNPTQNAAIQVSTNKSTFNKNDNITLSINTLPYQSLSVSVTHENSVKYYPELKPVYFLRKAIEIEQIMYPPETKKVLLGKVKDARGKPIQADIMVVRKDTFLLDNYKADKNGEFLVESAITKDTLVIDVLANDQKGKPISDISVSLPDPMPFSYKKTQKIQKVVEDLTGGFDFEQVVGKVISLGEVSVRAKRKDTTQIMRMHKIFGKPTYEFTNKTLNFEGRFHFILALQGRIAGLEIFFDAATGNIRFRSLKHGDWQPIIWLDGIRYDDINNLNFLTNDMIARIDVYRTNSAMIVPGRSAGLIAIYTKSFIAGDDLSIINTPPADGMRRFKFNGFSKPKTFHLPDYEQDKDKMNYYENRSTIYWNPDLKTNNSGQVDAVFPAIGKSGKYRVEVVGYDENGKVVKTESNFEIL